MHIRTPRAAIAADMQAPERAAPDFQARTESRPQTLWASRPLQVKAGRLIGVRLAGAELQVALVAPGSVHLHWVSVRSVLDERQAERWVRSSDFTRRR